MADEESRHGPGLADGQRVAPFESDSTPHNGDVAEPVALEEPGAVSAAGRASANGDDAGTDAVTAGSTGDTSEGPAPEGGLRADAPAADAADTDLSGTDAGHPDAAGTDVAATDAPGTGAGHRDVSGTDATGADADSTDAPEPGGSGGAESPAPAPAGQMRRGLFGRRRTEEKKHKKAPWWELPVLIAVAIAVAVLIKTFLVQPFYIPSESMEKTLHGCAGCSGDRVLVNKIVYDLRDPHPGDIVVFRAPPDWDEEPSPRAPSNPVVKGIRWFGQLIGFVPPDEKDLIKRVIAAGGQTVQCCDAQGRVQVSDHGTAGPWHSLDEPYIFENSPWDPRNRPGHIVSGGNDQRTFGPITIPKGRLWVMGDHRSDSADSRYHCIQGASADHICGTADTTVAVDKVIGKAVLIAWPPSRWRTLGTPATFTRAADAALPAVAAAAMVLPVFGALRRRRRK